MNSASIESQEIFKSSYKFSLVDDATSGLHQDAYQKSSSKIKNRVPASTDSAKLPFDPNDFCKPSPEYQIYINLALSQSISPEVFGNSKKILHEFDCQIKTSDDALTYANKVLARSGDSHTKVLTASQNAEEHSTSGTKIVGFGFDTVFDPEKSTDSKQIGLAISKVYPDSSASEVGLKNGDRILAVGKENLSQLKFDDAFAKLSGPEGTVAHLSINRNGKIIEVDTARKSFEPVAVTDSSLPDKIAYLGIDSFGDTSVPDQLQKAILKHADARGFVLDLRGNGGGDVDAANKTLSLMISDGLIATTRERSLSVNGGFDSLGKPKLISTSYVLGKDGISQIENPGGARSHLMETKERFDNLVGDRPVVVITDSGTASAAEIVTGAMHDTGHATTIGQRTYGKGIGQIYNYSDLPGGTGEKVTYMRYFTPSGLWPGDSEKNKIGINPDINVENPFGAIVLTNDDAQLKAATTYLRKKISGDN